MHTPSIIAALSLGLCFAAYAQGQPQVSTEHIDIDELIGPFDPSPESRAEARKEALAGYAWFSRSCRETTKGAALTSCLKQARQDRDNQLAWADRRSK